MKKIKGLEICCKIKRHEFIKVGELNTYMITCWTFTYFNDRQVVFEKLSDCVSKPPLLQHTSSIIIDYKL